MNITFATHAVPRLPSIGLPQHRRTPTFARRGTQRFARYRTSPRDCVHTAGPGPEWSDKPPVIASHAVIRWCEELCMTALLDTMPDSYCSLGTSQHLNHLAPIAVGTEIEITARCTRARGRYSSWRVTINDPHELIGHGRMDFIAVHRLHYETRRLAPKYLAVQHP